MTHSWAYTPYGTASTSPSGWRLKFNGEMLDGCAGGYHLGLGRRMYLFRLMRFASPDNFSPFLSGGLNPYAYCEGDPLNFSDPMGTNRIKRFKVPTLKRLAQNVLAKTESPLLDAASRSEGKIMGTIPLDLNGIWGGQPAKDYKQLVRNVNAQDIVASRPELKPQVKAMSRSAALDILLGVTVQWREVLPKHRQFIYGVSEFLDHVMPRTEGALLDAIPGAIKSGMNPSDGKKLMKWIRQVGDFKDYKLI